MRARGWCLATIVVALSTSAFAQQAPTSAINQIRKVEVANGTVRVTCSQQPNFTTLTLSAPPRLVVDFADTVLVDGPRQLDVHQNALASVKTEGFRSDTGSVARVIISLEGEADTDIEVGPDHSLSVHVTPVRTSTTVARKAPSAPKVEVVSEAQLQARADAQVRAASAEKSKAEQDKSKAEQDKSKAEQDKSKAEQDKSKAEEQARTATAAKERADGLAASEHQARADAEARAKQEADGRAAAEAKAKAAEERLAQLEAANRAAEQGRADAEAKAKSEAQARAAAEAQAAKERHAAEQAQAAEAAQAQQAQAAQQHAADEKRRADAAHAQQQAAEESARRSDLAAKAAQDSKQKQIEEAARQARLAEEAHQKQLAAEDARQAERDRLAQLEKQRESERKHAEAERDTQAHADAESKAEARQLADQQRIERKVAAAQTRPLAVANHPPPAPTPSPSITSGGEESAARGPTKEISLVGFRQTASGSRVFVRASDVVRYSVTQGGETRIVLEVENARIIQRNGTRPLDTSFFDGPVTLISPSEDHHAHSVKVEIELREMVPYETRLEGNDVVIDFQG